MDDPHDGQQPEPPDESLGRVIAFVGLILLILTLASLGCT